MRGVRGLFSRARRRDSGAASAPDAQQVRPLTRERVQELLERHGWVYETDCDGDLVGRWDDDLLTFMVRGESGEMLNVMGYMLADLPLERLDEVRFALEDWHREHIWPTCFWRENDDALTFSVGASHMVDWEHGVADCQLEQQVACAMGTIADAFADVRSRLALRADNLNESQW